MLPLSDTLLVNPHHVGSIFADEEGIILIVQGVRHVLRWSSPSTPITRGREFRRLANLITQEAHRVAAA